MVRIKGVSCFENSVVGVCKFLSSVLLQQKFEEADQCYSLVATQFKWQSSVSAWLHSVLFGKQRKIYPQVVRAGQPKRRERLNFGSSFYVFFSPPSEPALCKLR